MRSALTLCGGVEVLAKSIRESIRARLPETDLNAAKLARYSRVMPEIDPNKTAEDIKTLINGNDVEWFSGKEKLLRSIFTILGISFNEAVSQVYALGPKEREELSQRLRDQGACVVATCGGPAKRHSAQQAYDDVELEIYVTRTALRELCAVKP